jgi:uncharacterized SAM-binding protein YcdF (DUF218 family)
MRSNGHRLRWILAVVGVIVSVFLVLTALLFVWPSTNSPRHSDAIVVLGGTGPRLQKGLDLAREGYASYLAVSTPPGEPCPLAPRGVTVICFRADPLTTQGEARATAKLARQHHWSQIIVISGTPQTTRARIRFTRCVKGTLLFDPANPIGLRSWIYNVAYEWGALAKALVLQRGC